MFSHNCNILYPYLPVYVYRRNGSRIRSQMIRKGKGTAKTSDGMQNAECRMTYLDHVAPYDWLYPVPVLFCLPCHFFPSSAYKRIHMLQHSDANINTVAKGCRKKWIRVLHNKFMKFYLLRRDMTILPCPSTCSVFIHFSHALFPFLSNKLKLNFPIQRKLCSANFSSLFDCISPASAATFTSRQY